MRAVPVARPFRAGVPWLLVIAGLSGCGWLGGADEGATAESTPIEVSALPEAATYPKLRSVPPRPQLSYSVEQRREIVESLISDREHAQYTRHLVRYRTGRTSMPPPPPPEGAATAAAAPGLVPEAPPPVAVRRLGGAGADQGLDDGGLDDFMRDMMRETEPGAAAPEPPAAPEDAPADDAEVGAGADASPAGDVPAPAAAAAAVLPARRPADAASLHGEAERAAPRTGKGVTEVRLSALAPRPLLKPRAMPAAAPKRKPAVRTAAAGGAAETIGQGGPDYDGRRSGPRVIRFAAGSAELSPEAEPVLEGASAAAKAGGGAIAVTGRGEPMALALDRAYTVAVGLLRHGMSASDVTIGAKAEPGAHRVELVVGGNNDGAREGAADRDATIARSPRQP